MHMSITNDYKHWGTGGMVGERGSIGEKEYICKTLGNKKIKLN